MGCCVPIISSLLRILTVPPYKLSTTTIPYSWASVHGYFPASTVLQAFLVIGIVLFVAGYLGAKLLTLAVLTSASISATIGWCSAEALALLALRFFVEGRVWRFHIAGLSDTLPSLLIHACFYISILATPFPILRYVRCPFY